MPVWGIAMVPILSSSTMTPTCSLGGLVGVPVAREAVAPVLLAPRVSGCAYRLVRFQAGAEPTADGCRRRDKPGQNKQVAVAQRCVEVSAHHVWVEDEERPRQVH